MIYVSVAHPKDEHKNQPQENIVNDLICTLFPPILIVGLQEDSTTFDSVVVLAYIFILSLIFDPFSPEFSFFHSKNIKILNYSYFSLRIKSSKQIYNIYLIFVIKIQNDFINSL